MRTHLNITDPQERKFVAGALIKLRYIKRNNVFNTRYYVFICNWSQCWYDILNDKLIELGDIKL